MTSTAGIPYRREQMRYVLPGGKARMPFIHADRLSLRNELTHLPIRVRDLSIANFFDKFKSYKRNRMLSYI